MIFIVNTFKVKTEVILYFFPLLHRTPTTIILHRSIKNLARNLFKTRENPGKTFSNVHFFFFIEKINSMIY